MMKRLKFMFVVCLIGLLPACSSNIAPTITTTPRPIATYTPSPSPTLTPAIPVALGTPFPNPINSINSENVNQIIELARLEDENWHTQITLDGKRIIKTTTRELTIYELSDYENILNNSSDQVVNYDPSTNKMIIQIPLNCEELLDISPFGNYVLVNTDQSTRLYSEKGEILYEKKPKASSGAISPDGKLVAISDEENFEIYRIEDGQVVFSGVGSLYKFSPDGKFFSVIDKKLVLWDILNWEKWKEFPINVSSGYNPQFGLFTWHFALEKNVLIVSYADKLYEYDLSDGNLIEKIDGFITNKSGFLGLYDLKISPNGRYVMIKPIDSYYFAYGSYAYVFDLETKKWVQICDSGDPWYNLKINIKVYEDLFFKKNHVCNRGCLYFEHPANDFSAMYIGNNAEIINVKEIPNWVGEWYYRSFEFLEKSSRTLEFITLDPDGSSCMINEDSKILCDFCYKEVDRISYGQDSLFKKGSWFLYYLDWAEKEVIEKQFDVNKIDDYSCLYGESNVISEGLQLPSVRNGEYKMDEIIPDKDLILVHSWAMDPGLIVLLDLKSGNVLESWGKSIIEYGGYNYTRSLVRVSPDHHYLIFVYQGSRNPIMVIYDTNLRKVLIEQSIYYPTDAFDFSPDSKTLVYIDREMKGKILQNQVITLDIDSKTTNVVYEFEYDWTKVPNTLQLSPDGKLIALGTYDGSIIIIDSFGNKLYEWKVFPGNNIVKIAFSNDGRYLASASENGIIQLWGTSPYNWTVNEIPNPSVEINQPNPTPIALWSLLPTPPLYDDFESKGLDIDKWDKGEGASVDGSSGQYSYKQDNGVLEINSNEDIQSADFGLPLAGARSILQIQAFEARLKIDRESEGFAFAKIGIRADLHDNDWYTQCRLGNSLQYQPTFVCDVARDLGGYGVVYQTNEVPINFDQWYTVRIEIQPNSGAIQYYLDGNLISAYLPDDADELTLKNIWFYPNIGAWTSSGSITAYIDDVRISENK
jgi:WD40 repeat protein